MTHGQASSMPLQRRCGARLPPYMTALPAGLTQGDIGPADPEWRAALPGQTRSVLAAQCHKPPAVAEAFAVLIVGLVSGVIASPPTGVSQARIGQGGLAGRNDDIPVTEAESEVACRRFGGAVPLSAKPLIEEVKSVRWGDARSKPCWEG
ncbi:hypothetical protein FQA39_LY19374 [Lamprigera yunnana]|nr:hypothetical protein FQA39_LY19374 [Lamprigera yunnana]